MHAADGATRLLHLHCWLCHSDNLSGSYLGVTKWKNQEEPYKFELRLPADKKKPPAWIRAMAEPPQSDPSDDDDDDDDDDDSLDDFSTDDGGSDDEAAATAGGDSGFGDGGSSGGLYAGAATDHQAPSGQSLISSLQSLPVDPMLLGWLCDGDGAALLGDAVGAAQHDARVAALAAQICKDGLQSNPI